MFVSTSAKGLQLYCPSRTYPEIPYCILYFSAIADMIVTFLHMPLAIGWSLTVYWMAGDFFCRLLKFFDIFGMFLSSNILICISLDRFYAIVFPLSSGKAANFIKILLFGAWVVSILCAAPQVSSLFLNSDGSSTRNPGFGFWKCRGEMGKIFGNYWMIFHIAIAALKLC